MTLATYHASAPSRALSPNAARTNIETAVRNLNKALDDLVRADRDESARRAHSAQRDADAKIAVRKAQARTAKAARQRAISVDPQFLNGIADTLDAVAAASVRGERNVPDRLGDMAAEIRAALVNELEQGS
jgi:hypothetical protein